MKRIITAMLLGGMLLLLCGCTQTKDMTLTVRNITGEPISELRIWPESDAVDRENRLSEVLADGSEVQLALGVLTEEALADGFAVEAVNAEDGSFDAFGSLMLHDGDTLTLYWDDMGLAAAVNTSDAEIQEMIDALHEDVQNHSAH